MFALAFNGLGLAATAKRMLENNPDSAFWKSVKYQFSHVEWAGCAFWDLIQPSFMFMVGVSMAYSYVRRSAQGATYTSMIRHAAVRVVILVLLGIFLISNNKEFTNWSLMNVLTQIGLGYLFLFLMWRKSFLIQLITCVVLLIGTWMAYALFPTSGINVSTGDDSVGVSAPWAQEHLSGLPPAWHKNANVGHRLDLWLLNRLPTQLEFKFNAGGYQTINFIPSLATMIFGLMAGELLRSSRSGRGKLIWLLSAGLCGVVLGLLADHFAFCPMVKRIWTPSWTLFSAGICAAILAAFFAIIDLAGWRAWSFPLVVIGMNSIAIYVMGQLLSSWTLNTLQTHFGSALFTICGPAWQPTVQAILVGLCFWLACYWMYRQKIFVRI
jgi:heparan-alpha-glucosaminide N-acetyltransferase